MKFEGEDDLHFRVFCCGAGQFRDSVLNQGRFIFINEDKGRPPKLSLK